MQTGPLFEPVAGDHRTRGHQLRLRKPLAVKTVRRHHLGVRAIGDWNSLPQDVVAAPSLNSFKSSLDQFWCEKWYI